MIEILSMIETTVPCETQECREIVGIETLAWPPWMDSKQVDLYLNFFMLIWFDRFVINYFYTVILIFTWDNIMGGFRS